jgi:CRISPR-associated protein Csb2
MREGSLQPLSLTWKGRSVIKLDIDALRDPGETGRFARYRDQPHRHAADPPRSVFDEDLVVYARTFGPWLPITSAAGLSRQFRRALMSTADQPVDEILSGHVADGSPSQTAHLAIVPLPAVTGPLADGALLGIALVLPRGASREARCAVTRAMARLEQHRRANSERGGRAVTLLLGESGELVLRRAGWGELPGATLTPRTWTRSSTRWASATPVALDRNPGDLHAAAPGTRAAALEAARSSIVESVRRIGLPAPIEVDVVRSCVLPGTVSPRAYPRAAGGAHQLHRVLVHVRLRFAERVRGPMLLGAGRYQGVGLCLPVDRTWVAAA